MVMIKEPKRWLAIATLVLLTSVFAVAQHGASLDPETAGAAVVVAGDATAAEGMAGVTAGVTISRNLVSRSRKAVLLPNISLPSVPRA